MIWICTYLTWLWHDQLQHTRSRCLHHWCQSYQVASEDSEYKAWVILTVIYLSVLVFYSSWSLFKENWFEGDKWEHFSFYVKYFFKDAVKDFSNCSITLILQRHAIQSDVNNPKTKQNYSLPESLSDWLIFIYVLFTWTCDVTEICDVWEHRFQ